jgi:hypothetical protein
MEHVLTAAQVVWLLVQQAQTEWVLAVSSLSGAALFSSAVRPV